MRGCTPECHFLPGKSAPTGKGAIENRRFRVGHLDLGLNIKRPHGGHLLLGEHGASDAPVYARYQLLDIILAGHNSLVVVAGMPELVKLAGHVAKNNQFKEAMRCSIGQQAVVDIMTPVP